MLPGKRIVLAAAITVLALLGFMLLSGEKEPSYNGRSLTDWGFEWHMAQYKDPLEKEQAKEQARAAIRAMGTNGIPWALEQIPRPFSPALYKLSKLPLFSGVYTAPEYRRKMAAHLFYINGSDAAPWLPRLVKILAEAEAYDVRERVTLCMAAIGDDAAPQLSEILRNPRHPAWTHVVGHLQGHGPHSDPARVFLIPSSNAEMYTKLRWDLAVAGVVRISREHSNETLRIAALSALAELGERDSIELVLDDPAPAIRLAATNAWQRAQTNTVKMEPYPR